MSPIQETSLEAYEEVQPKLERRQRQVLDAVRHYGSACDQQIADFTGLPINSITPRRNELMAKGLLVDHGIGIGPHGRHVHFWGLKKY